jgi:hypothetical protein
MLWTVQKPGGLFKFEIVTWYYTYWTKRECSVDSAYDYGRHLFKLTKQRPAEYPVDPNEFHHKPTINLQETD